MSKTDFGYIPLNIANGIREFSVANPGKIAIIDGNRFKVKKVNSKFLPIAYEIGWKTQKKMVEHYQKPSILCDFLIG